MIPVEGHKNLYREESGAIVNTDTNGYINYMRAKNKKLIASHDKPTFKSVPATGVRADQPASDLLKKIVTPGGLIKGGTINNPFGVKA